MNTLKEIGYGHISVIVDESLHSKINEYIKANSVTKIKFYNNLLNNFLEYSPDYYLATRNGSNLRKFLMWIEPEIFSKLKILSEKKHVTLRAICYTALIDFFNKEQRKVA